MIKKHGFTLIELLAVIVVLAIIALIATPIVMNTIKNAKKGSAERTVDNYIKQVEVAVAIERLEGNILEGTYTINDKGNLEGNGLTKPLVIGMNGNKPTWWIMKISNGQVPTDSKMTISSYEVAYNPTTKKYEATQSTNYDLNDLFSAKTLKFDSMHTASDNVTTNEFDCSSFVQLTMEGVDYDNSKYTWKVSNIKNYNYGIKFPKNKYNSTQYRTENLIDSNNEYRYYANEIANYGYENGFFYNGADDYSNVKPSDIVFFSFSGGDQFSQKAFLGIAHAGILLETKNNESITVIHSNDAKKPNGNVNVSTYGNNYFSKIAFRIPGFSYKWQDSNNLIKDGEFGKTGVKQSTASGLIKTLTLKEKLKLNTAYSLECKLLYNEDDSFYYGIRGNVDGSDQTLDKYIRVNNTKLSKPKNDIYISYFIIGDVAPVNIKPYLLGSTDIAKNANATLYYCRLYEGLLTKPALEG